MMQPFNKDEKIVRKLSEELGVPHLAELLANTPFRKLVPILISAWRQKASNRTPQELPQEYEARMPFYGVGSTDQRSLQVFSQGFYDSLPANFDTLELSPIAPLGVNSVLSKVSQDVTLSTIRGSEVVGDPTTSLSLECARRRKSLLIQPDTRHEAVNLATVHRVLRLQAFDSSKGYMQHFRIFGLFSGGRDIQGQRFTAMSSIEHISLWLDTLEHLRQYGYEFGDICVKLSAITLTQHLIDFLGLPRDVVSLNSLNEDFDLFQEYDIRLPREVARVGEIGARHIAQYGLGNQLPRLKAIEEQIAEPLRAQYPNVTVCFDFARKAGLGYYQDMCYHVFARNKAGRVIQLADGGDVDWLAKLLSSKKERAVSSGFGAELVQKLFSPAN